MPSHHAPRDGLLVLQVGHVSPRGIELDEMGTTGETRPILDVGVPPVLAVTCGVVASAACSGEENGPKVGWRESTPRCRQAMRSILCGRYGTLIQVVVVVVVVIEPGPIVTRS
jgi:hypothetical protein